MGPEMFGNFTSKAACSDHCGGAAGRREECDLLAHGQFVGGSEPLSSIPDRQARWAISPKAVALKADGPVGFSRSMKPWRRFGKTTCPLTLPEKVVSGHYLPYTP